MLPDISSTTFSSPDAGCHAVADPQGLGSWPGRRHAMWRVLAELAAPARPSQRAIPRSAATMTYNVRNGARALGGGRLSPDWRGGATGARVGGVGGTGPSIAEGNSAIGRNNDIQRENGAGGACAGVCFGHIVMAVPGRCQWISPGHPSRHRAAG
jgi:hypothetical protein